MLNEKPYTTHEPFALAPVHVPGTDVRRLAEGTTLVVATRNSTYRLVIRDPEARTASIQGGKFFETPIPGRIEGSTIGGGPIDVGHVQVGQCLALYAAETPIITSRVYAITIEPAAAA